MCKSAIRSASKKQADLHTCGSYLFYMRKKKQNHNSHATKIHSQLQKIEFSLIRLLLYWLTVKKNITNDET